MPTQSLVLRSQIGRRLTIAEMDGNFTYLEDLAQTGGISPGLCNTISEDSLYSSTIGGGYNTISYCSIYSSIIGGFCNSIICSSKTTILGGCCNYVGSNDYYGTNSAGTIIGAADSALGLASFNSSILGGSDNTVA